MTIRSLEQRSGSWRVEDYDKSDEPEKIRMLTKLFALYPRQEDKEYRIEAYLEELRGVPWRWVGRGLRRLTDEPDRRWCPSISEVKRAISEEILAARRKADPSFTAALSAGATGDGQLAWIRRQVTESLERGILPPGTRHQTLSVGPGGENGSGDVPADEFDWNMKPEGIL